MDLRWILLQKNIYMQEAEKYRRPVTFSLRTMLGENRLNKHVRENQLNIKHDSANNISGSDLP